MKPLLACLSVLIFSSAASEAGEPSLKCDFSEAGLPEGWKAVKGEWKAADGVLTGAELASDNHAAVFNIPDPHLNSEFHARIRFDGAKGLHLSYNHAKGHLFRLSISGESATLSMDKDKKDPSSKVEVLDRKAFKADPGAWLELTCKVEGNQVKVTLGDLVLEGSHPNLAKEKTGYRLIVQGQSMGVDDVAFASSN